MRLDGDGLVVGGSFFGAFGIFQRGGKVAELALDGSDFQVAWRGGVMAEFVHFVIRIESQIVFPLGLVDIALGQGLCEGIAGILSEYRGRRSDKKQNREGSSVHGGISKFCGDPSRLEALYHRWT